MVVQNLFFKTHRHIVFVFRVLVASLYLDNIVLFQVSSFRLLKIRIKYDLKKYACNLAVVVAASFFFCSLREPQVTKEKDIAEDAT
jgi:hypothetical protein